MERGKDFGKYSIISSHFLSPIEWCLLMILLSPPQITQCLISFYHTLTHDIYIDVLFQSHPFSFIKYEVIHSLQWKISWQSLADSHTNITLDRIQRVLIVWFL